MKLKIVIAVALAILILSLGFFAFIHGCEAPGRRGIATGPPPISKPVWQNVRRIENPRIPELNQEGGDIVLEDFGEAIGFCPMPDEDREILALDWQDGIVGFYVLDLHDRIALSLGGIQLKGPCPVLESFEWPWVLLQSEDNSGNRNWILADISSGQAEIAWESSAWVPQGLRRKPVWFSGETWYLGPVSGPVVTDILKNTLAANVDINLVNPVLHTWPRWAGGADGSPWCLYPADGGGSFLLNLEKGTCLTLEQDQELAWNREGTLLAWCQEKKLGLVDTQGRVKTLEAGGVVPGDPLWSANGDNLFFLGGEEGFFGIAWKTLWVWEQQSGPNKLFDLPGNWKRWRLLAATDEAVLATAGNGDNLFYFDLSREKSYKLNLTGSWSWQGGTLVAIQKGEMIRITPGFELRVLAREAEGYEILALANQFVFYCREGRIFIKQLIL
jgi:hypothetical protein